MKNYEVIWFFLVLAVANSFAIIGIFHAADDGMILEKPRKFLERNIGKFWSKPFLGCPTCMASIWGGLPLFIMLITNTKDLPFSAISTAAYTCLVSGLATSFHAFFIGKRIESDFRVKTYDGEGKLLLTETRKKIKYRKK